MRVSFQEISGTTRVGELRFDLLSPSTATAAFHRNGTGGFSMYWNGDFAAGPPDVKLDHFLPYIDVSVIQLGRNDARRAYLNGWLTCFATSIEHLRTILGEMQYLSSAREVPKERNEPVSAPPNEVGAN